MKPGSPAAFDGEVAGFEEGDEAVGEFALEFEGAIFDFAAAVGGGAAEEEMLRFFFFRRELSSGRICGRVAERSEIECGEGIGPQFRCGIRGDALFFLPRHG